MMTKQELTESAYELTGGNLKDMAVPQSPSLSMWSICASMNLSRAVKLRFTSVAVHPLRFGLHRRDNPDSTARRTSLKPAINQGETMKGAKDVDAILIGTTNDSAVACGQADRRNEEGSQQPKSCRHRKLPPLICFRTSNIIITPHR